MSDSDKPISDTRSDRLSNRFRDSLIFDNSNKNKPDSKQLDPGSPVSPLLTRHPGRPAQGGLTTTSSSSSSSSGSLSGLNGPKPSPKRSESGSNTHSGELSGSVSSSPNRVPKPGHTRSDSGSVVNSPSQINVQPTGNILPAGSTVLKKSVIASNNSTRNSKHDVLGSGSVNYGHGSIMRGGPTTAARAGANGAGNNAEEVKRLGNEAYRAGNIGEALNLYERAVSMSPGNATYRFNRAVALAALGRLAEAVRECEEAVRLDPGYVKAHHRLGSIFLRVGQVENARRHICFPGCQPDANELQKLQAVEMHLRKCTDARKIGDWRSAMREADAAIAAGADASPELHTCKVEALLKLQQLEDASSSLSNIPPFEPSTPSWSKSKIFGMLSEAYLLFVQVQIEMAFGRFENAVAAAEKASQIDPRNVDISVLLNNVRLVSRARARGNDLFKSERYTEACSAYGEGLRLAPSNAILYCNRAACWYYRGLWERSLDDCNQALRIQPNYTKALLRRAASNNKLERWAEAVRDYEVLRRELPNDTEVAESLFHAQVALKKSRGEDVHNMKFGGEVESVWGLEQFRAAISSPVASVVHFNTATNHQCKQISPFLDTLCVRYPSVNFLKVDVEETPAVAAAENVRIVPTFKIYKKGSRVKEMVCPSPEVLESSVRHYSF